MLHPEMIVPDLPCTFVKVSQIMLDLSMHMQWVIKDKYYLITHVDYCTTQQIVVVQLHFTGNFTKLQ